LIDHIPEDQPKDTGIENDSPIELNQPEDAGIENDSPMELNQLENKEEVQINAPELAENEQHLDEESINKEEVFQEMHYEEKTTLPIDNNEEPLAKEPTTKEELPQKINHQHINTLPTDKVQPLTETMPIVLEPTIYAEEYSQSRYFLRKRKLDKDRDDLEDGYREKVIRAMIAMSIIPGQMFNVEVINTLYLIDPHIRHGIIKAFITILDQEVEHPQDKAFPAQEIGGIKIPRTYNEAISDRKYGEEWKAAINEEITSLVANGIWEEFILPKGANLVSTKWVFTIKTKSDGSIERLKARLVARGFSQVYGQDFIETFAPTVCMDTFRLFKFIAVTAK
jgi:hypothetical protein